MILIDPVLFVLQDTVLYGIEENWLIFMVDIPNEKPEVMGFDVFKPENGFDELPKSIFDGLPDLTRDAMSNQRILPDDVGAYIWDKVFTYKKHGYGVTSQEAQWFEKMNSLAVDIGIKNFFQPYNMQHHIFVFEKAVMPLVKKLDELVR